MGKKILFIDCSAGITGEKFLGSLIDLGADEKGIRDATNSIKHFVRGCISLDLSVLDVKRRGIGAKLVRVEVEEMSKLREGWQVKLLVKKCVEGAGLSRKAKAFPLKVVDTILEAESKVHREEPSKICLYELGSAKVIALLTGISKALENLNLLADVEIYSNPPALGGGFVITSHGKLTVPTPATLQILSAKKFPSVGGPIETELTTPLGAAVLVNLVDRVVRTYPMMKVKAIGYGAGEEDYEEIPNVLRTILGEKL